MTESFVERELKFDVAAGFVVPDLSAALPDGARSEATKERLRSEYYDTASGALLSAHMTLRRRTGTTDVGWQLKVPDEPFRQEIRVDGAGEHVPSELSDLLLGVAAGEPLVHVASLVTERSVTRLLGPEGIPLAEVDDDSVHAVAPSGAAVTDWREVEVELATGSDDVDLLDRLAGCLAEAGARPAVSTSKLGRALSHTAPGAAGGGSGAERGVVRAADVIAPYIAAQRRVILAGDLALRRGDPGAIHKTRVGTRRLRSTLRTFGRLVDRDRATQLDSELRWFAGLMGEVRDRQVLRQRLDTMLSATDETLLLGPVRTRIHRELDQEQAEHWRRLQQEMTGPRYLSLVADVARWVGEPAWSASADRPAETIRGLVKKADRTVSKRLERANASGDADELHAARKAAKRARYAAEAAEPVLGAKRSAKRARRYETLQDLLGEHQDSLVSAEVLRRLGAAAGSSEGENGFAFGILHERERENAEAARLTARKQARKYR